MSIAAGPFAIAAILLFLGGLLKATRPSDTAHALRIAGLGFAGSGLVRVVGAVEAGIGIWALVRGDRWSAITVAASYTAFGIFVAWALVRRLPIASCGCFGKADTPPSLLHLGVNAGAAIAASAVAVQPGVGIASVLDAQPALGIGFVVLVATGVVVAFAMLTVLPQVTGLTQVSRARADS